MNACTILLWAVGGYVVGSIVGDVLGYLDGRKRTRRRRSV